MENDAAQMVPRKPGVASLLVSYYYLDRFLRGKVRFNYNFRDWVMDSGAFSAHNSGKVISLEKYIEVCLKLLAEDKQLTEVFSLDVIYNPEASVENTEKMWQAGVPAIPTFHFGEPWEFLQEMAKQYPKIALGGAVRKSNK